VAVALAGINLEPRRIRVTLDPRAWGAPVGARIVRHDEQGTREVGRIRGERQTLDIEMGALQALVLELRR